MLKDHILKGVVFVLVLEEWEILVSGDKENRYSREHDY